MVESLDKIKEIKRKFEKKWLAHPAVVGVGIGILSTGRMGLIISVLKSDKTITDFFPGTIEGISIELQESGKIEAQ